MEHETITSEVMDPDDFNTYAGCNLIYIDPGYILDGSGKSSEGIENKDLSDRFLTTLILSLIVCLANIGLALFGFLLFRTPGDF